MSTTPQSTFQSLTVLLIGRLNELGLHWVYGVGPEGARFVVEGVELTPTEVADRHFEGGWEAALAARWPRDKQEHLRQHVHVPLADGEALRPAG